jgi:ferredoxin
MAEELPVTVRDGDREETLSVKRGTTLRRALRDADFEVYAPAAKVANCGGRGICATCGVRVCDGTGDEPDADHWHDALAARYGYPRLSCQLTVDRPLTVELIEKRYWGQLLPRRE